jgi:hypothetical protein
MDFRRSSPLAWLVVVLLGCAGAPAPTQQTSAVPRPSPSTIATQQPAASHAATPEPSNEGDLYIGGTITWTAQATKTDVGTDPMVQTVTGTANIVIHVLTPYLLLAERDGGSTYSYDYTNNYDCASSHEEGTLESQAGVGGTEDWDYSIATLNPGAPLGEDLHLQILMPDYCGPSMGGEVDKTRPYFSGFPDCEPSGDQLWARFDGVENYVIDCDAVFGFSGVDNNIGQVTGHVSGTLSPLDGP